MGHHSSRDTIPLFPLPLESDKESQQWEEGCLVLYLAYFDTNMLLSRNTSFIPSLLLSHSNAKMYPNAKLHMVTKIK